MSTQAVDPRLQLIPPGTQPRVWMFSLCVLLPTAITAAALMAVSTGDAHLDFAGINPAFAMVALAGS